MQKLLSIITLLLIITVSNNSLMIAMQTPEQEREQQAINNYLAKHEYISPVECRNGGYSTAFKEELIRERIKAGLLRINSKGELEKTIKPINRSFKTAKPVFMDTKPVVKNIDLFHIQ